MNVIQNPAVWALGIVALAIVLIVALIWSRKNLRITGGGLDVAVDAPSAPGAEHRVSVAEGAVLEGKVGDVVGVRGAANAGPVAVAKNAHFKNQAGDIVGVDLTGDRK